MTPTRMFAAATSLLAALGMAQAQTLNMAKALDSPHYDSQRTTWSPTSDVTHMIQDTLVALDWDGKTAVPLLASGHAHEWLPRERAPRRIGALPARTGIDVDALEDIEDVDDGEFEETDRAEPPAPPPDPPAPPTAAQPGPTPSGKKWEPADYRKWAAQKNHDGISDAQLLAALAVDSFERFQGSVADAEAKLDDYIAAQMRKPETT